ncbi:delta-60 repeat domain-containing protein [Oligoflexus tunisiensis]|uniref:delta-60 repeat domain-containing protein n=1 Tax=Oligoflexus tunisiensis TaxID=708132 RepID=UPI001C405C40|nr:delta-60 repeat domain-containing protein [Oligoflexus tunisiensis]
MRTCKRVGNKFVSVAALLVVALLVDWGAGIQADPTVRAAGELDPAFGTGGMVGMDFGGGDGEVFGMALQRDGRIVLAGSGRPSSNRLVDFALMRLRPDGSLDTGFGVGGKVTTSFTEYYGSAAKAVAVQPDQKLVVVGYARNLSYAHDTFALARYDSSGRLDPTFGTNGKVLTPIYPQTGAGVNDMAQAVAIAPDGKIVVAGVTGTFLADFAVARYHRDGSLDTSFGGDGTVVTDIGGQDSANAVLIQPDGKILVAGGGWTSGPHVNFTLVRYNSNGSLDTSFGSGGIVTTDFNGGADRAQGLALLPDGRIVVAGVGQVSGGCFPNPCERYGVALAQYHADGTLDTSFGSGGGALYDFLSTSGTYALARRADGKLVLGGHHGNEDFLIILCHANGALDESFGGTGAVVVGFGPGADRANALAIQPDGMIVAAGRAAPDTLLSQFGVVRIQAPPHNR